MCVAVWLSLCSIETSILYYYYYNSQLNIQLNKRLSILSIEHCVFLTNHCVKVSGE